MLGWIYLILAIALETAGTICVKLSENFTLIWPSIFIFVFYGISFIVFLPLSYKSIEPSVVYAVWAGLGAVFVTLIGVFAMHESITFLQCVAIAMIIIGVISLKLNQKPPTEEVKNNTE
ncbi:MAG: multidrug efflux SMR transporter [Oscillatoria sp. PMC 1051.18]|uniref:DMT family transporter n=1 Tax=Oscillatoria salina TaxID=331517 RepID=UPI0013BC896F|nr:multidrug efflux SMR transporter [Oscillatoria salina]MBZ8179161.1 multidrug efflux SMR transporter [Oscillatoria salina IIICB1]MEC4893290.1 multidrug efflux SMR transporter [Oscillatoria sp. PMC 1050.18]MEC5030012.1 multidrug efflux SMR transporter [Oscillatoria sp. PMC 1051.18]NET88054.1 multidrug efflux SMR transporter [Kamptonema sp. SIO1D9]